MNWLLIVVLVILGALTIFGYIRGFMKMLVSMAALLLTVGITWYATPKVAEVLERHTPIYKTVKEQTYRYLSTEVEKQVKELYGDTIQAIDGMLENELINYLTDEQEQSVIQALPLPKVIQEKLTENNNPEQYDRMGVFTFCDYLSTAIADLLIQAMALALTFLVALVMIRLAVFALDIIAKIPVIHGINKLAGGFLGLIEGFFVIWILFMVITAASGTEIGREMMILIQDNEILSFLYDKNIFLRMVMTAIMIVM